MGREDLRRERPVWSRLRAGRQDSRQVEVDAKLAERVDVVAVLARLDVVNELEETFLDVDNEHGGIGAVQPVVGVLGRDG